MNILVVNSSAQGEASVSAGLARDFVRGLQTADPSVQVTVRDVGADPLPHLVPETVNGLRGVAQTEAELGALALSDALIAELREADLIVIGAPMYNFGIPSTLKAWFDHVLRARVTFRYTENGPEGLLRDKRAVVIESRAGVYSEGPAARTDHQEGHLRTILAFIGIEDVRFVRVEGTAFGAESAAKAIDTARAELNRDVEQHLKQAA